MLYHLLYSDKSYETEAMKMAIGSMRTILLFMIFIMRYISKFLPKSEEEPIEEEKKVQEEGLSFRAYFVF